MWFSWSERIVLTLKIVLIIYLKVSAKTAHHLPRSEDAAPVEWGRISILYLRNKTSERIRTSQRVCSGGRLIKVIMEGRAPGNITEQTSFPFVITTVK